MRILVLLALLSGCAGSVSSLSLASPVAEAEIDTRLLLIGDAGAPRPEDPVLAALTDRIARDPAHTVVVFLGDNIYPRGMPDSADDTRRDAERRLDAQVAAAHGARAVLFVPGNHDWDRQGAGGWEAIRRQGTYLAKGGEALLLPADGCPGPVTLDLSPNLRLVALDTQWWLHEGPHPDSSSSCEEGSPQAVIRATATALATAGDRVVVVVGHHPLVSSGPHGGRFTWQDHLFPLRAAAPWAWLPLPVVGSLYPLARSRGYSPQDESSERYRTLYDALAAAFTPRAPLLYVAGHEHALEVHDGPFAKYSLVSGAGSSEHTNPLLPRDDVLFARAEGGFMQVDVLADHRVRLSVITLAPDGRPQERWSKWVQ